MASKDYKLDTVTEAFGMSTAHISGTATVTAGNTSVVVTHALGTTPTVVLATPTSCTPFHVDTIGATEFTINIPVALGADCVFLWRAEE